MTRPIFRWLLFAMCLAVLLGAMLWISARTLDLEAQRKSGAEEAQRQERVRLALWRMDSLASVLLIRENARPASHYQAFYAPEELFANDDNRQIPKGMALQPSPLLGAPPDMVQLHFELVLDTPGACSPQAPTGTQAAMASQWSAGLPQTQVLSTKLARISDLLKRHPELQNPQGPPVGDLKITSTAANDSKKPALKEDLPPEQSLANERELSQRSKIVSQNIANEKMEMFNSLLKNAAPPEPKPRSRSLLPRLSGLYEESSTPPPAVKDIALEPLPTLAGDLRPVWVENELLLLRRATLDGRARLQGVWLDWPKLQERLYGTVRDLLPHAALIPIPPEMANKEAAALVTLPVRLVPGMVPIHVTGSKSALKPALTVAWGCVLLAALAIGFVLHRAMLLSERRGAFVSSVTHELRTPLTTFRLYSEMLAEDMVPDAEQRRSYLQTLCDESTRLMHLVENVLAFSRIERGRVAARLETLSVDELMQRITPRLRQRADQVNLQFRVECPAEVAALRVRADALAVEQILFNLVDNACKYAAPDSEPHQINLSTAATAKTVIFEVRDFGPGLSPQARKKLFQPFAKSATEAAHSAPGVGLGLALCRRLARDLGGELAFCPSPSRGACFRLSLDRT
ncbi:MAG TPA: HAMP domain-containing sensor histidine kinase [Prosthecobacter sp.]|nr:HAMP domain-containing sensor histidine kinase [Prosthecobacter sp.]